VQSIRDVLDSLAQQPGTAVTLAAAAIAGVVALVVAVVNAWSARALARSAAHRAYRQEMMAPVLVFSRALMKSVGPLVSYTAGGAPWAVVKPLLDHVVFEFVEISRSTPTLYSSSTLVQSALPCLDRAKQALTDRFQTVVEPAASMAHNAALTQYGETVQASAVAVEVAAEAYVYGGVWRHLDARLRVFRASDMLRRQKSV
jgi:ABC-type amino acid transport system permease subunit